MKNLFDLSVFCFFFRFAVCSDRIGKHTLNQNTTLKKKKRGKTNKVVDFVYLLFFQTSERKKKHSNRPK